MQCKHYSAISYSTHNKNEHFTFREDIGWLVGWLVGGFVGWWIGWFVFFSREENKAVLSHMFSYIQYLFPLKMQAALG